MGGYVPATWIGGGKMICWHCKKEIEDDSRYCVYCRQRQDLPLKGKIPKGKTNKTVRVVIIVVLLLAAAAGISRILIKPTINLNKYLSVTFDGYDTVGTAEVYFNSEKFAKDYGSKLAEKMNINSSSWESLLENNTNNNNSVAAGRFISENVSGSLDRDNGLKNGDIVTYIWNCRDQYVLETYGYKLKYKDAEFEVSNLKTVETFDPFDGITVVFEGIEPNGQARIEKNESKDEISELDYELDVEEGLKNGDTVTVSLYDYYEEESNEYFLREFGKIPSAREKTYKVEGLGSYIHSIAEVSPECLEEMKSQAKDVYDAYMAQNRGEGEALEDFTYLGSCLLMSKDVENSWDDLNNIFYLVYDVGIRNSYEGEGQRYEKRNHIYWYISYYDLEVDSEGNTKTDITRYDTPSNEVTVDSGVSDGWGTMEWDYYGYQTLDELYEAVVTANAAEYKSEENLDRTKAEENAAADVGKENISADEGDKTVSASERDEDAELEKMEETSQEDTGLSTKAENADGMIFPNSSNEILDESEIVPKTDEELRYAVNEIYARNGYIFKDKTLLAYYQQYDWYHGTVKSEDFSDSRLNAIEKRNVEILQQEREKRE